MNIFKLDEKQIDNWGKIKSKGIFRYLIKWAFITSLGFGIPFNCYNLFFSQITFELTNFILILTISFFGGVLIGLLNWLLMEYGYKISKK